VLKNDNTKGMGLGSPEAEGLRSKGQLTPIPLFVPSLDDKEIAAVAHCLRSGWLTTGAICAKFEQEFAATISENVKAVGVNSATAGLHLVLDALGIGPGDEVIVPTLTFAASAEVVHRVGAEVRFVDSDAASLNITARHIQAAITPRTRAVIVVHFAGLPCDLDAILEVCNEHNIAVIEDAAHCFPAQWRGLPIGAHRTAATVFSFYANKSITTGEGGMIVTHDDVMASRCRVMRLHGLQHSGSSAASDVARARDYDIVRPGFKYNLADVAAAIGREQLKKAEGLRDRRAEIAAAYDEQLQGLPLKLAPRNPEAIHGWHLYVVELARSVQISRDKVVAKLGAAGIATSVHYRPLHQMSYWRGRYNLTDADLPNASEYFLRCLSLPFYPSLRSSQIDYIVEVLASVIK
jgi:dTDP-4-amino-4,6-dideoxygalactose transaminase